MTRPGGTIADQLRAAIAKAEQKGITRYRLAKKSGVSKSTISQFCNSCSQLRLDIAEALALALGMKLHLTRRGQ
jgi:transcriptional regulator with XRE-family HTH domain